MKQKNIIVLEHEVSSVIIMVKVLLFGYMTTVIKLQCRSHGVRPLVSFSNCRIRSSKF